MDRGSDSFFSQVIDAAPDGIVIVDGDGVIEFANQQACEIFQIAHEVLVGTNVDDLLPAELQRSHRAHRLRYRAEPKVRPMGHGRQLVAMRGDGVALPVEISLSPLSGVEGFHVVAAVRDVTARVEAEDQMRQVLVTLDATEDAVFIMDAETLRFTYVNDGASRQVGYRRDELLQMTPLHINPELSEPDLRRLIEQMAEDEQTAISIRGTHYRNDGVEVPVEMSLKAVRQKRDAALSVIIVARDITARLEAEQQMRRSEQALREAEQVMAITDDRERIARDLHDTVIQRLFASGLALQAASVRAEPEVAGRLENVVNDLDETIREIRTAIFALQASQPVERGKRGELLDVVREATESLGFEPRLQFEGPIETIDADVFEQLLPTLREALSNVARHAKASSVRVVVEVDEDVTLTVTDNGVGVPEAVIGGRGLGNMRERAAGLGGSFTIEACEPSGTRLVWRLPGDR